jgi:beta-lactamase regulating signal transducer with metallopeptidase domain
MMADSTVWLWCLLQATLLGAMGLAAGVALMRRAPQAAATVGAAAIAMILAVTFAAPVELPTLDWFSRGANDAANADSVASATDDSSTAPDANTPVFDPRALATQLLAAADRVASGDAGRGATWVRWAYAIAALGAAAGLLRLGSAIAFATRVRRRATAVTDATTRAAFEELGERLGTPRSIVLLESCEIISPAVVGWRRPAVLLPTERAEWTEEQVRATLAHELAHVARRDFAWRVAAALAQAVHFFNPIVHLLARRFALAQEVAADRTAAAALSNGRYLKCLSELVLRADEPAWMRRTAFVLPSFFSSLERRVDMLRSKEGSENVTMRRAMGAVAAGLIVLAGVATTALRGGAEDAANDGDVRQAALFARTPLALPHLGGAHKGLFVVRLGELARRAETASFVELLSSSVAQTWPLDFGVEAPALDLTAIEYVAGVPQLTVEPVEESDDPEVNGRVMFGAGEWIVRFTGAVELAPWLAKYIPAAAAHAEDGLTYYELPEMGWMGQIPMRVAQLDERTVVFAWGADRLKAIAAGLPDESTADEAAQWAALDGGLITLVADDANVARDMATPDAPLAAEVLKRVDRYGFSFDLDAAGVAGVRVALSCGDEAAAEGVAKAVEGLAPQLAAQVKSQLAMPDEVFAVVPETGEPITVERHSDPERAYMQFWIRAIEACHVRVETSDTGAVCVVTSTAEFPTGLPEMQDVAERAAGGGESQPRTR